MNTQTAHATTLNSSSFPEFTQDQWRALSQLLTKKNNSCSDKLSVNINNTDLILDTRASHHMTGDLSFLEHVVRIPPCPVGFADDNKMFATHIRVLPISIRITLVDVLFVLN